MKTTAILGALGVLVLTLSGCVAETGDGSEDTDTSEDAVTADLLSKGEWHPYGDYQDHGVLMGQAQPRFRTLDMRVKSERQEFRYTHMNCTDAALGDAVESSCRMESTDWQSQFHFVVHGGTNWRERMLYLYAEGDSHYTMRLHFRLSPDGHTLRIINKASWNDSEATETMRECLALPWSHNLQTNPGCRKVMQVLHND